MFLHSVPLRKVWLNYKLEKVNDFRISGGSGEGGGGSRRQDHPGLQTAVLPASPVLELDLPGIPALSHWRHSLDLVEAFQAQIFPVKPFRLSNLLFTMKCCFIGSVPICCNKQRDQIWGEIEWLRGNKRSTYIFKIVTLTNVSGIILEGNISWWTQNPACNWKRIIGLNRVSFSVLGRMCADGYNL